MQQSQPPAEDGPSTSNSRPEVLLLNGMRGLLIKLDTPIGQTAGSLSHILRQDTRAAVEFNSPLGILKFLKTAAVANQFLNQHGHALSFTFRIPRNNSQQTSPHEQPDSESSQPQQGSAAPAPAHHAASTSSAHDASSSAAEEPVPWLPKCLFRPMAWMRAQEVPEVDLRSRRGMQMFDFALDIRREWRQVAYVSVDTALAIADNVYSQLMAQVNAGQHPSPAISQSIATATPTGIPAVRSKGLQHIDSSSTSSSNGSSGTTSPSTSITPTTAAGRPPKPAPVNAPGMKPLLLGADLSQATLVYAALAYLDERLYREHCPYKLAITIFRNTTVAPRLDGRNGFVFRVQLVPRKQLSWLFWPGEARPPRHYSSRPMQKRLGTGGKGRQQGAAAGRQAAAGKHAPVASAAARAQAVAGEQGGAGGSAAAGVGVKGNGKAGKSAGGKVKAAAIGTGIKSKLEDAQQNGTETQTTEGAGVAAAEAVDA